MEYLLAILLVSTAESASLTKARIPLVNNVRAPLVAELDITSINSELKDYIDIETEIQVNETCDAKIKTVLNDKISELKSDLMEDFSHRLNQTKDSCDALLNRFTGKNTMLEYLLMNENDKHDRNIKDREDWNRQFIEKSGLKSYIEELVNNLTSTHKKSILMTCGGRANDCTDLKNRNCTDGVYQLSPDGITPFYAYCDFSTHSGGWTVIQRRQNGEQDFYRSWQDYKDGFGDVANEYWLGNEKIFQLTSKAHYELRIELQDWNGEKRYAVYKPFLLGNEASNYPLSIGIYSGNAGDSLSYNNGKPFSTKDKENCRPHNCAQQTVGAWWYGGCTYSNLNGEYLRGKHNKSDNHRGVVWNHWTGWYYSLQSSIMMIRRY